MRKDFLRRFVEKDLYLQNPPFKTDKFIGFCKQRDIHTNENELEFFEKEGLFYPILRVENPTNSIGNHSYITLSFEEFEKDLIKRLFRENKIIDPSKVDFQDHFTFKTKELKIGNQKISNFYSSFQIDWLKRIKDVIHLDSGKEILITEQKKFEHIQEFLILIQVYSPYGRSDSRTIRVNPDSQEWYEKIKKFNLQEVLDYLELDIEFVLFLYWQFSFKIQEILGHDDWIQLWKHISWNEKDELKGPIRLGIEYLQWSLMLKRCIEDFHGNIIFDIDEARGYSPDDLLKIDPSKETSRTLRGVRNRDFIDETGKSYYYERYKRLYYLANIFNLDYQARVMVFVEGETEEEMFPKIFRWYYDYPENHGIEIVNFKGVDKLLSTSKNAEELKNLIDNIQRDLKEKCITTTQRVKLTRLIKKLKKTDIIISNWTSFISYNLEKWQIIPFFVSDNEGNVKHFIDAGKPIRFQGTNYDIPNNWKYLWGITNENKPFYGNNFEFSNFSDKEILLAINQVLDDELNINKIKEIRERGEGIKKIDNRILISQNKRKIVRVLFDNLFKEYEKRQDISILKRPIFQLIEEIIEIAKLNHLPRNTTIENENKKIIFDLLNEN